MLIEILCVIATIVVILGGCGLIKSICKRYINNKWSEEKHYVQNCSKN
jgi:hypothetical protein